MPVNYIHVIQMRRRDEIDPIMSVMKNKYVLPQLVSDTTTFVNY